MNVINTISPQALKQRLADGESMNIIDVREDEEVAAGMIPGAQHIPLGQLPERISEIAQTQEIILVCRSGNRSGRACEFLRNQGLKGIVNMTGGMLEWENTEG
ncbi:sulfurtransferase [Paenibacillus swuensis]|uniref:Sulfurtransferase n=1 Tax=Paenibacillus swuensis TaxID=1178515 RepID=A0A172TKD0_9BACL|nr:rhodanese-like domain-containing protein [Paenibacillus swuensis]ANE47432.1 sulfurtransferase [Paenibacillus swuensis]